MTPDRPGDADIADSPAGYSPAPLPPDEASRLRSLDACGAFDGPPDPDLDDVARLAASACGVRYAFATLIGRDRQAFKGRFGSDLEGCGRDVAFCAHAILTPDRLMVVPDLALDARFAGNPLVAGGPGVRFYAGAPLVVADGHALGSLCVLDVAPRPGGLSAEQAGQLAALGRLAARLLDQRRTLADAARVEKAMRERNVALARQRAFLDNLVAVLPSAAFWKDRDSVYLGCNQAFARDVGLSSPAEVVGMTDHDLPFGPDLAKRYRDDDAAVMDAGRARTGYEETIRRADGSTGVLVTSKAPLRDADGAVVGVLGAYQDATDARRVEQALVRTTALVRAQQEASIDAILVVDEAGRVASLNARFFEVWDIPADLRRSEPPFDDRFLPFIVQNRVADPAGFVARVKELYGRPDDTSRDEVALRDGRTLDRYSGPLRTGDGEHVGRIWYFRDITDRKRTETDLRLARDAADAANRSKSEFLANMSHEIRTPMTAILGFADLLDDPQQSADDRRACVGTIRRNGEHLLGVLNDVLDVAKVEAGEMAVERVACSPVRIVADVASLLRARAGAKGLAFDVLYDGPVPERIATDPTRFRQVLMNLVSNAVKFTSPPTNAAALAGRVEVRIDLLDPPTDPAPRLRVRVSDTGPGLSGEQQSRLFRPFQQGDSSTTRKFGGTGLGLAISRHLVGLLGGTVVVCSMPGRGSTFCFTVGTGPLAGVKMLGRRGAITPEAALLAGEPTPAAAPVVPVAAPGGPAARRVLLAEDGPDNQRLIGLLLRKLGLDVTIAADGRAAVTAAMGAAGSPAGPFDLVLMDMQMPELDGYAATAELRRRGYAGPVVALTAHAMAGDRERCLAAGCDDFLTKPIDRPAFAATVAAWLPGGERREAAERDREDSGSADPAEPPAPLVSTLADDPDLGPLVALFVADLPRRAADLAALRGAGDADGVERLAHQLRGAGGSYGFDPITDRADDAECRLRSAPPGATGPERLSLAAVELDALIALLGTARRCAAPADVARAA